MRILLVLICSSALAFVNASAQETKPEKQKKKAAPTAQAQPSKPAGKPAQTGKPAVAPGKPADVGKAKAGGKPVEGGKPTEVTKPREPKQQRQQPTHAEKPEVAKGKQTGKPEETAKAAQGAKATGAAKPEPGTKPEVAGAAAGKPGKAGVTAGKPVKPQHFNVPQQPNTAKAPPVKFQQGKHIEGSQNWQGQQYTVFRNYTSEWHDQGWWHSHHNNIVFVFGAPYFFNAGYWFPAWGYSPNAYYAWDGPIYAYNNLPPDQVIANVQTELQQQGYYQDEVDGLLGPQTRGALAAYQRDHGLAETAAIDQPTLQSLGMA
jgi:hypothetical protein